MLDSCKFASRISLVFAILVSSQMAQSNVIGVDTQNFNTITSGLDFVTVHSSETLAPGVLNLGLFINYGVNTLPFYSKPGSSEDSRLGKIRDAITAGDLNFGLGLTNNWDFGISFPFIIDQMVKSSDARGQFDKRGLTEVRVNTKYRLIGDRTGGLAGIFTVNANTIENNPFVGKGGGPIFNFELAADTTFYHRLAMAVNLGYRWRNPGKQNEEFPIEPTKNQYIGSFAASYLLPNLDTKVIFETFGSIAAHTTKSQVDRNESSAESLLGIKYDVNSNWALHFGGGTELSHSVASPDWRVYVGTNVTFGPMWGEKDKSQITQPKVTKRKPKKLRRPRRTQNVPSSPTIGMGDQTEIAEDSYEPPVPVGPGVEYPSDADETFVLKDIHFAFDSDYRALPGAKALLGGLAKHLKDRNFKRLVIEGHTDSVGSNAYNIDLGARRAVTVKNYLVQEFGLVRERIKTITYGESRPVGDNGNFQGRQLNRRVVFRVYYTDNPEANAGW